MFQAIHRLCDGRLDAELEALGPADPGIRRAR